MALGPLAGERGRRELVALDAGRVLLHSRPQHDGERRAKAAVAVRHGGRREAVVSAVSASARATAAAGDDVYAYFDNDAQGHAPHDAVRLLAAVQAGAAKPSRAAAAVARADALTALTTASRLPPCRTAPADFARRSPT